MARKKAEPPIKVGETCTTARLKRANVMSKNDTYAKHNCKWEVLDIQSRIRRMHGGAMTLVHEVTLKGKPKTQAGKIRKNPIKIRRVFN